MGKALRNNKRAARSASAGVSTGSGRDGSKARHGGGRSRNAPRDVRSSEPIQQQTKDESENQSVRGVQPAGLKFTPYEIKVMPLSALKDHPQNPRTIRDAALKGLAASIHEFGLIEPIIWNKRTGHIVGGHQRRRALADAGYYEAQVVVVDFDEQKEIGALLSLNNGAIQGEYTDAAYQLAYDYKELYPEKAYALMLSKLVDAYGLEPGGANIEYQQTFEVIVTCKNEAEQRELFEKLTEEGRQCRVLSL